MRVHRRLHNRDNVCYVKVLFGRVSNVHVVYEWEEEMIEFGVKYVEHLLQQYDCVFIQFARLRGREARKNVERSLGVTFAIVCECKDDCQQHFVNTLWFRSRTRRFFDGRVTKRQSTFAFSRTLSMLVTFAFGTHECE